GTPPGKGRANGPPRLPSLHAYVLQRARAARRPRCAVLPPNDQPFTTDRTALRITALEPQAHHPDRVNVFVDGAFRCGLALEIAYGGGLRVGDEITEERLAELERKDLLWKAREAAFNLLSYRARSEAELRQRLRRKEFPDDVVEACVADLVEKGYVDDASFAASFVRDRVRGKPRGSRRLVQELRAK